MRGCKVHLRVFLTSALTIAVVHVHALPAAADGAYRWFDASGRVHYGSNPPKDARNVQSLAGKSFSRYSSDKLLKPFHGNPGTVSEADIKAGIKHTSKPSVRSLAPPDIDPMSEETLLPELEQGPLSVKHDKQKRVIECSVVVRNSANIPANNVIVNFEFGDGTLVPATGPESIDAGSSAKFTVPEQMLPITVNGVVGEVGPKPKVMIKGGA